MNVTIYGYREVFLLSIQLTKQSLLLSSVYSSSIEAARLYSTVNNHRKAKSCNSSTMVVWMTNVPQSLAFEYLVFSWWPCLGKLRKYGLAGGMCLGVGFENVKMYTISSIFSDLFVCGLPRELSAAAFATSYSTLPSWTLTLQNHNSKINPSNKLPWSWF